MLVILDERRAHQIAFVKSCLDAQASEELFRFKYCLGGFLRRCDAELVATLIEEANNDNDSRSLLTLMLCLPYGAAVWCYVDGQPKAFREAYWRSVEPHILTKLHGEDEINRTIDELLAVRRAPAALEAVRMIWGKVETSRLRKLLDALLSTDREDFSIQHTTGHYIAKCFEVLDKRPGVTVEEKARLEFAYLPLIHRSKYGIRNLETYITGSPEFYAQAIAYLYERSDDGVDPPELLLEDDKQRVRVAENAYQLLKEVYRIPGTDEQSTIDIYVLKRWLGRVRALCGQWGRAEIGDAEIGELLARALPPDADEDVWPCGPVCEVLQWMASEAVNEGFETGAYNSGSVMVGEGGGAERKIAARYHGWARRLVHEFPYVGALLGRIAATYDRQAAHSDTQAEVRGRLFGH